MNNVELKLLVRKVVREQKKTDFNSVYEEVLKRFCTDGANSRELSFQTTMALEEVKNEGNHPECANLFI